MNLNVSVTTNSSENNTVINTFRSVSLLALSSLNIIGLLENFIIMCVICKTRAFKRISRVLVLNTALADIGMDLITVFFLLQAYIESLRFSNTLYKLILISMLLSCVFHSSYSMMGTAISVYMAICHQIRFAQIRVWKVNVIVLGLWIVNSGLAFLHFLTNGYYSINPVTSAISVTYDKSTWWFGCLVLLNATGIPLLVTSICFYKVRYYCNLLSKTYRASAGFQKTINMLALARMNMMCFTVFMVSWIAIMITQAVELPRGATAAVSLFVFSYRFCKLFFYIVFYPPFRRQLKRMLLCGNKTSSDTPSESSNEKY